MRMRFSAEDDEFDAFQESSVDLVDRFAAWMRRQGMRADPSDVSMLLEWRYNYADGALDVWTVGDVEEFLLEWCPRKLSADPDDVEDLPGSIAAWVEFLAHEGLLANGSDAASRVREYCAGITSRFRAEMADPRNFGMAKSLFTGGALPIEPVELPESVGPVRMPRPEDIVEVVRTGHVLPMARKLAQFCAPPGRKLTAKGNLRLADARAAVVALDTGDDPGLGGFRTFQSAEELPVLSSCIRIGIAAGAVRRHDGRLIAVARFAKLDDVTAHDALARAGLAAALAANSGDRYEEALAEITDNLLAMLLDGPVEGADLLDLTEQVLMSRFPVGMNTIRALVPSTAKRITHALHWLDLVDLEMVQCDDCPDDHPMFELTPAGVRPAAERVRAVGVDVVELPDPAEAVAAELVAGIMVTGPAFTGDVQVWLAAQADAGVAVDELGAAVVAAEREPAEVLVALTMLEELELSGLPEAVHRHLSAVHESLLLPWLVQHGQVDDTNIDPAMMVRSIVDVAAVMIDLGAPGDAVDAFLGPEAIPMLRDIWRLDHPRLAEVLESVGRQHPVKAIAKEARRSLMKLRSRR